MRRFSFAAVPLVLLIGCGKPQPTMAGGKPVSHWVEELQTSPDPKARKEAAFKLGNVGPSDPTALPALVGAMKDRDAAVRAEVTRSVVKFGSGAAEAVPALTDLRERDPDPKVRTYAKKALEKLQRPE